MSDREGYEPGDYKGRDPARIRRVLRQRSRAYLITRWIIRGIVKIGLVLLFLWCARWFIILFWAGFGS